MSEEGFTVFPSGYVSLFKLSKEELEERKNRPGLQKFLNKVGFERAKQGDVHHFVYVENETKNPIHPKAKHFPSGSKNLNKSADRVKVEEFRRNSLLKGHVRI